MVNIQLLEYIRKQLSAGMAREEIERTLTQGGGWAKSDVDEAFAGMATKVSDIFVPPKAEIPIANRPLEPYIQTSQVVTNNNLSSQQNFATPIQSNLSGNALRSSVDLLKESFSVYKNKFGSFAIALSPLILTAIFISLTPLISVNYLVFTVLIVTIVSFILLTLSMSSLFFVMTNRERDLSFSEIINGGFSKMLSLAWIMIISYFIISAGSVLFIIPGIIFSVWFSFPLSILFAEDKKGMDALLLSKEYVKGYWGSVAWRTLAFILIFYILSFVVFAPIFFIGGLIGLNTDFLGTLFDLLLVPISFIYGYLLYENVKKLKSGVVLQIGSKTPFIVIAILGGLFIPLIIFGSIAFGLLNLLKSADVNVDTFSNININSGDSVVKNCGTDWNCLIESAKNCSLASFENKIDSDLFGVNMKTDGVLEIKGEESGGCNLYGRNDKYDVTFPSGTPAEIVDATKDQYKGLEGKAYLCKYKIKEDLVSVLENWKVGNFDNQISCPSDGSKCEYGGDFKNADCSGSVFDQTLNTGVEFKGSIVSDSSDADWKTYKNDKYGFQLKYPPLGETQEIIGQVCNSEDAPASFMDIIVSNGTIRISSLGAKVLCGNFSTDKNFLRTTEEITIGGQVYKATGYINNQIGGKSEYFEINIGNNTIHLIINQADDMYGKITDQQYNDIRNTLLNIINTYKIIATAND